jgi:hypothetical protein
MLSLLVGISPTLVAAWLNTGSRHCVAQSATTFGNSG